LIGDAIANSSLLKLKQATPTLVVKFAYVFVGFGDEC
jgi:hypothetical protein